MPNYCLLPFVTVGDNAIFCCFCSVEAISDTPVIQQQVQTCHIPNDENCFGLPYQVRNRKLHDLDNGYYAEVESETTKIKLCNINVRLGLFFTRNFGHYFGHFIASKILDLNSKLANFFFFSVLHQEFRLIIKKIRLTLPCCMFL